MTQLFVGSSMKNAVSSDSPSCADIGTCATIEGKMMNIVSNTVNP